MLAIQKTAIVDGDVSYQVLRVEDGANISGKLVRYSEKQLGSESYTDAMDVIAGTNVRTLAAKESDTSPLQQAHETIGKQAAA